MHGNVKKGSKLLLLSIGHLQRVREFLRAREFQIAYLRDGDMEEYCFAKASGGINNFLWHISVLLCLSLLFKFLTIMACRHVTFFLIKRFLNR